MTPPPYFGEVYEIFGISLNKHARTQRKVAIFLLSPTPPRILAKFMGFSVFQRMDMRERKKKRLFFHLAPRPPYFGEVYGVFRIFSSEALVQCSANFWRFYVLAQCWWSAIVVLEKC